MSVVGGIARTFDRPKIANQDTIANRDTIVAHVALCVGCVDDGRALCGRVAVSTDPHAGHAPAGVGQYQRDGEHEDHDSS
jgi:hypothetical protein